MSQTLSSARRGAPPPSRAGGYRGPKHDPLTVAALVLPFVALFAVFYALPIGYALWQSLFALKRPSAYAPARSTFVGLDNYGLVIADPAFRRSLLHVLAFGVGPSTLMVITALILALLIDSRASGRLARFVRAALFSPFAVPAVIGAIIWGFLYAPSTSPLVGAARAVGWNIDPLAGSPVWAVGNVAIWTYLGFNVLIFLAGLATLDPSVMESAKIDGASALRVAWAIKIPLIMPSIILGIVFNLIGTLQLFTEPTALKSLTDAIPSGWTPTMLAYSEAAANRYSFSAAVSTLLAIVTAIVSFGLLRIASRKSAS